MQNSFRIIDFNESIKLHKDKIGGWLGQARKDVMMKDEEEKFQIARKHFINAMHYRAPRLQSQEKSMSCFFGVVYGVQTSLTWQVFLVILTYIFMYLVLITIKKPSTPQLLTQSLILSIFILDITMQLYHKSYQILRTKSRFQSRFYYKIFYLTLLVVDEILAGVREESTVFVRPFLVVRCFLPNFYHRGLRKNVQAMFALYKDVVVFTMFYAGVILLFTVLAQRFIGSPKTQPYDEFTQNYSNFPRALFLMYTLSSFQSYPDNQLKSIKQHPAAYPFFITFLILNLFLFITIPTSLLFNEFKDVRSRIMLVDQIKQQNSLILAFTCLCGDDLEIRSDRFIRFLLGCFRNKGGYLDQITKIAMEVDENNNGKIQITQFMQIIKIMHSHPSLYPPIFSDYAPWIRFRTHINTTYGLKSLVLSLKFKIITCALILFSVVNCLLNIYLKFGVFQVVDYVIAGVFVGELGVKMVGLGPEGYFKDPWNKLDFVLILCIAAIQLWPNAQKSAHIDVLFKLTRSYRIALLPQYLLPKPKYLQVQHISIRISRLISQLLNTIPIVVQFFPLYMIFFYFFGIIGLQIFGNFTPADAKTSPYSAYEEIANFDSFLYSQFYMVQVMVEAGWSVVAYDHAYRYPVPVAITMVFFVATHFSITLVVSSLVKGITWQVYQTIQQTHNTQTLKQHLLQKQQQKLQHRKSQLQSFKAQMNLNKTIPLQNLIQREIFQGKVDLEILNKMQQAARNPRSDYMVRRGKDHGRHLLMPMLVKELSNGSFDQVDMLLHNRSSQEEQQQLQQPFLNQSVLRLSEMNIGETSKKDGVKEQAHTDADIDEEIQRLIGQAAIDGKNAYLQTITYPSQLLQILQQKLITIQAYNTTQSTKKHEQQTNINSQQLQLLLLKTKPRSKPTPFSTANPTPTFSNPTTQNTQFLIESLRSLLDITSSQRERKLKVISDFIEKDIITEEVGKKLVYKRKSQKSIWLSPTWILRETFLNNTSQKLVQKYQLEHFRRIYGEDFKEINQITMQPLIRLESKLMYALRNILRYRQIEQIHFFTILNKIQDEISTKLLKKGSLFKFVYQIDSISETWFTIEVMQRSKIRAHFIKNGIWIWHKKMKQDQLYIGQDFFYLKEIQEDSFVFQNFGNGDKKDRKENRQFYLEKCAKLLFQTFQTLAMGLPSQDSFFLPDPTAEIYDLYCHWRNVEEIKRKEMKRFSISKIMAVILSHQGKRLHNNQQDTLKYQLTDLVIQDQSLQKLPLKQDDIFYLDQPYRDILPKVSKLQTMDEQQIQQSEGLPHAFIVNLMDQISDLLKTYQENFVGRLESLINKDVLLLPFANSQRFGVGSSRDGVGEQGRNRVGRNLVVSSEIEEILEDQSYANSQNFQNNMLESSRRRIIKFQQDLDQSESYRSSISNIDHLPKKSQN